MATTIIRNGDIRQMGLEVSAIWPRVRGEIKLSGKSTFALIGIKKNIERLTDDLNDAFLSIGLSHGGQPQEDGSIKVPPENIEKVNEKLTEVAREEVSLEYEPIIIREEDSIPTDLMDLFYNFIQMK